MPDDLGKQMMTTGVATLARHCAAKKGNRRQSMHYCTSSLISHHSKIMLMFNRLHTMTKECPGEQQAGFSAGVITVEHL